VILNTPGDLAVDFNDQEDAGAIAAQLYRDLVGGLRLTPPPCHRFFGQDRAQRCDVSKATRTDGGPRASKHG
jgi:hypothetical protein